MLYGGEKEATGWKYSGLAVSDGLSRIAGRVPSLPLTVPRYEEYLGISLELARIELATSSVRVKRSPN